MFTPGSPLAALLAAPMRPGRVVWIGVRPARRHPMLARDAAAVDPATGLEGDRYCTVGGRRQVTLIGQEDLAAIASYLGRDAIAPDLLRRNVVTAGLNLLALKGRRLQVGTAVLEVTGECHPCSRMEDILGVGGYNAVRSHGGITAQVISPGIIQVNAIIKG